MGTDVGGMTAASASRRRWALLLAWLASPAALFFAVLELGAALMRCDEGCQDAPSRGGRAEPAQGFDWRETSTAWQWGLLAVFAIVALVIFLSFLLFVAQRQRRRAKYALFAYLLLTFLTMAWSAGRPPADQLAQFAEWQNPAELVPLAAALAAAVGAVWLTPPRDDDARTQPQQETPRPALSLDAEVEQLGRERDDWRERTREV